MCDLFLLLIFSFFYMTLFVGTHFVRSYNHILNVRDRHLLHLVALEIKMVKNLNQLMPVTLASAGGSQEEREPSLLYICCPQGGES